MTRRTVRLSGNETEAQRARRLAYVAWRGYAASSFVPRHPVDGDVFVDGFCAGYAAALSDEVKEPRKRQRSKG